MNRDTLANILIVVTLRTLDKNFLELNEITKLVNLNSTGNFLFDSINFATLWTLHSDPNSYLEVLFFFFSVNLSIFGEKPEF